MGRKKFTGFEQFYLDKVQPYYEQVKMANITTEQSVKVDFKTLNSEQKKVIEMIQQYLRNPQGEQYKMILHGGAGCGKTYLLHAIREILEKAKQKYVVCSFTGNSSFNCSGTTFHYKFRIPFAFRAASVYPAGQDLYSEFRKVQWILMDEMSMIGAGFGGFISQRLKALKFSNLPFGGLNYIMMGDFYQLRPIGDPMIFKKPDDYGKVANPPLEHFGYEAYIGADKCVILETSMRQKDDNAFFDILNRIRKAKINADDLEVLNSRSLQTKDDELNSAFSEEKILEFATKAVYLHPRKHFVNEFNKSRVAKLQEETGNKIYKIFPTYKGKFTPSDKILEENSLLLIVGSRVFLTKNFAPYLGYFNGALGTVVRILEDPSGNPVLIFVKFDNVFGPKFMDSDEFPIIRTDNSTFGKKGDLSYSTNMFPLESAFALTVHKVQSLTLDKVIIGVPDPRVARSSMYAMFAPSLAYTALSRCRALTDVAFDFRVSPEMIVTNNPSFCQVRIEEERLRALQDLMD